MSDRFAPSLDHLRELWLDGNLQLQTGIVSLAMALRQQTSGLELASRAPRRSALHTLSLARCALTDITPLCRVLSTVTAVTNARDLSKNGFQLKRINLSKNDFGDEGGRSLFLALLQAAPEAGPQWIDLSECGLGDQAALQAAAFVTHSRTVRSLRLGAFEILPSLILTLVSDILLQVDSRQSSWTRWRKSFAQRHACTPDFV